MADTGKNLYPGLGFCGQRVLYPLAVLIENPADLLAALFKTTLAYGFDLFFEFKAQLLHRSRHPAVQESP